MERSRLLQCLAADYLRLRTVAGTGLTAPVPSCPGWTVTDLVRHVAMVYLHKAAVMHTGAWPDPWPPSATATEHPIALLDRAYGELTHEFSRRDDTTPALTWHAPEQTVKFWIRRMAQESVIHRIDAELALHAEIAPVPTDLAIDGIDEVLQLFVAYGSRAWREDFAAALSGVKDRTIRVQTSPTPEPAQLGEGSWDGSPSGPPADPAGARAWLIRTDPDGVTVTRTRAETPAPGTATPGTTTSAGPTAAPSPLARSAPGPSTSAGSATSGPATSTTAATTVDAVVTGPPADLLRWLWARESGPTADAQSSIQVEGDGEAIAELRRLLAAGTQ